jgi:hypothetical protein
VQMKEFSLAHCLFIQTEICGNALGVKEEYVMNYGIWAIAICYSVVLQGNILGF